MRSNPNVFCICLLTYTNTNRYQKYKSVELGDQLGKNRTCKRSGNTFDKIKNLTKIWLSYHLGYEKKKLGGNL